MDRPRGRNHHRDLLVRRVHRAGGDVAASQVLSLRPVQRWPSGGCVWGV